MALCLIIQTGFSLLVCFHLGEVPLEPVQYRSLLGPVLVHISVEVWCDYDHVWHDAVNHHDQISQSGSMLVIPKILAIYKLIF